MREVPFQLLRPPKPPPERFGELFGSPISVDIGNCRKVELQDGVFGKKTEIRFSVAFISHRSVLHVVEKSYEELSEFNRICFERRLIIAPTHKMFPSLPRALPKTNNKQPTNNEGPVRRSSLMMSFGAAMGSPLKEVTDISKNKDCVNALVVGIKIWLSSLWNDQPLFHRLDYVQSFFEVIEKAHIPVKPHLWSPNSYSVEAPLLDQSTRTPVGLAARIAAEAAALQPKAPPDPVSVEEEAEEKRPSLGMLIGLNRRGGGADHGHYDESEGNEELLRVTFKEANYGLSIVNGDGSKDSNGKFNGPLFVHGATGQAAALGVEVGDKILAYNDKPVKKGLNCHEFKLKLKRKGRPLILTLGRKRTAPPPLPMSPSQEENREVSRLSEPEEDTQVIAPDPALSLSALQALDDETPAATSTALVVSSPSSPRVFASDEFMCKVLGSRLCFIEIYENQRYNTILEPHWGSSAFPGHMLPTDRSAWSNEDGSVGIEVVNGDLSRINPPPGFEWSGNWKVDLDYTPCDDKGFSYAMDFWLLTGMQEDGSSLESDADACFARRRRWRRPVILPHPPMTPTPYLSALTTADADGKGIYSRRAVALGMNVVHQITMKDNREESYQCVLSFLGDKGFQALWRGSGIAIICNTHSSAKALARALVSCGWPATLFTSGKTSSLVEDTHAVHSPCIFVCTDVDIKSTLEETVNAATEAQKGAGGDGIDLKLLPLPIDVLIHFELPKDFGTFLRRIERVFRGRFTETDSNLISLCLAVDNEDRVLLPWIASLVSDADQLDGSPALNDLVLKLKESLEKFKKAELENEKNKEDSYEDSDGGILNGQNALSWDMMGAMGNVLAYNFGGNDDDDEIEGFEHIKLTTIDGGDDDDDGDGSTLYVNEGVQGATAASPFLNQQLSGSNSNLLDLPLFGATATLSEETTPTVSSMSYGDEEF